MLKDKLKELHYLRRSNRAITSIAIFLSVFITACDGSAPPPTPTSSCSQGSKAQSARLTLIEEKQISFEKDILPILSSARDDEVYKCTFCHSGYSKEETFAEQSKIDNVIAQVEELRMPLNGDEMRKDQIELIKRWRDQKFPKQVNVETKPINWNEIPADSKPSDDSSRGC